MKRRFLKNDCSVATAKSCLSTRLTIHVEVKQSGAYIPKFVTRTRFGASFGHGSVH